MAMISDAVCKRRFNLLLERFKSNPSLTRIQYRNYYPSALFGELEKYVAKAEPSTEENIMDFIKNKSIRDSKSSKVSATWPR